MYVCPGTPPAGGAYRVWALGDSGTGTSEAQVVLDAYRRVYTTDATDLMLQLGDNAVRRALCGGDTVTDTAAHACVLECSSCG